MENKSKIFSYIVLVLTFIFLGFLIFYYVRRNFLGVKTSDFTAILPYFITLTVMPLIIIIKSKKLITWIKFAINGLLIGSGISLLFILATALPRLELILRDGTSFWMFIWLPIIFIGYPLVVFGALIGLAIGLIYKKIKTDKK